MKIITPTLQHSNAPFSSVSPLLEVDDVRVCFSKGGRTVRAVDGVTFQIAPGSSVGLVGESGSGKSTLGRAVLKLERIQSGRIVYDGVDLAGLKGAAMKRFRRRAQMVFQDPSGSLNPRMSVGRTLREVLFVHRIGDRSDRMRRVRELLKLVGLDPDYAARYPHEFSGGQRQRIGIARALSLEPKLIVADEPVSALDVSVQVQILNLMNELRNKLGLTYLFIAHDLAVIRYVCDEVLVMYLGRIVERASVDELYSNPRHPYTRLLLESVPDVKKGLKNREKTKSGVCPQRTAEWGQTPQKGQTQYRESYVAENRDNAPLKDDSCPFIDRCSWADDVCRNSVPVLKQVAKAHLCACHRSAELEEYVCPRNV